MSTPERTQEELAAKENYVTWKRLLRTQPLAHDLQTYEKLWSGALELLMVGKETGSRGFLKT